jgi:hypothetical protein
MEKTLATAVGSFVGTAACLTTLAVVSSVTKKIERAKRTKREAAHKETTQK